MAEGSGRRRAKKTGSARRKYSTSADTRLQLEGITAAQAQYRQAKREQEQDAGAGDEPLEGIPIVDSREKSEQAYRNALRGVRRPEDLDDFD